MENVDLNLIPGDTFPVCHVSQYDVGRTIQLNLFDGTDIYTLDGTESITLNVRKPDNHTVSLVISNTSSTYVRFATTEQMTACPGHNICELTIDNSSNLISTLNFLMAVDEDPLSSGVTSVYAMRDLESQIRNIIGS